MIILTTTRPGIENVLTKHFRHYGVMFSLLFVIEGSSAQNRPFGLGVIVGEPTGISAKAWISDYTALDFGLGWSMDGDRIGKFVSTDHGSNRIHMHMDYLWHAWDVIDESHGLPLYYGLGGRLNSGPGYTSAIALRGLLGVAWLLQGTSIDVFIEVAPSYQLTSTTGFGIDAGVGARYYF